MRRRWLTHLSLQLLLPRRGFQRLTVQLRAHGVCNLLPRRSGGLPRRRAARGTSPHAQGPWIASQQPRITRRARCATMSKCSTSCVSASSPSSLVTSLPPSRVASLPLTLLRALSLRPRGAVLGPAEELPHLRCSLPPQQCVLMPMPIPAMACQVRRRQGARPRRAAGCLVQHLLHAAPRVQRILGGDGQKATCAGGRPRPSRSRSAGVRAR